MKKFFILLLSALFFFSAALSVFSADKTEKDTSDIKIKVYLKTGETAFCLNNLSMIIISGEEVPAFLEVKNILNKNFKEFSAEKKDGGNITFTYGQANNLMYFMNKTQFKGQEAEYYQEIVTKVLNALKKELE